MPTGHFYQDGGCLPPEIPSYIVRKADQELEDHLKNDHFCYILTARQMGKSSMRVRVSKKLSEEGFACVSIDITQVGSKNLSQVESWYYTLLSITCKQLGLDMKLSEWWKQNSSLTPVNRFFNFITEDALRLCDKKIVIFLDEIDSILSIDRNIFDSDDFFAAIRAIYNARAEKPELTRVNFVVIGVASPNELMNDPARTPFNVGKSIQLENFTMQEAAPLKKGLQYLPVPTDLLLSEIFYWSNGQPVITQKICLSLISEPHPNGDLKAMVKKHVDDLFLNNSLTDNNNINLLYIQTRILDDEKYGIRILQLYEKILHEEYINIVSGDTAQIYLKLTGLVMNCNGQLRVNNRIYHEKLNQQWIEETKSKIDRPYNAALKEWIDNNKIEEKALRGIALQRYNRWCYASNDLSIIEKEFQVFSNNISSREEERVKLLAIQREKEIEEQKRLEAERQKGEVEIAQAEAEKARAQAQAIQSEKRRKNIVLGAIMLAMVLAAALLYYLFVLRKQMKEADIRVLDAVEKENAAQLSVESSNARLDQLRNDSARLVYRHSIVEDSFRANQKKISSQQADLIRQNKELQSSLYARQEDNKILKRVTDSLGDLYQKSVSETRRLSEALDKRYNLKKENPWLYNFDTTEQNEILNQYLSTSDSAAQKKILATYKYASNAIETAPTDPNKSLWYACNALKSMDSPIIKNKYKSIVDNSVFYSRKYRLSTLIPTDSSANSEEITRLSDDMLLFRYGFDFYLFNIKTKTHADIKVPSQSGLILKYTYNDVLKTIGILTNSYELFLFDLNGRLISRDQLPTRIFVNQYLLKIYLKDPTSLIVKSMENGRLKFNEVNIDNFKEQPFYSDIVEKQATSWFRSHKKVASKFLTQSLLSEFDAHHNSYIFCCSDQQGTITILSATYPSTVTVIGGFDFSSNYEYLYSSLCDSQEDVLVWSSNKLVSIGLNGSVVFYSIDGLNNYVASSDPDQSLLLNTTDGLILYDTKTSSQRLVNSSFSQFSSFMNNYVLFIDENYLYLYDFKNTNKSYVYLVTQYVDPFRSEFETVTPIRRFAAPTQQYYRK